MDVFCLHEIYTKIYVFCVIYLLTSHRWTVYLCTNTKTESTGNQMWYHIWFPMLLKFKSLSTDSGDICFKKSIGRRQASFPFPFYLTKTFHFPAKYNTSKKIAFCLRLLRSPVSKRLYTRKMNHIKISSGRRQASFSTSKKQKNPFVTSQLIPIPQLTG